jgi:hypothetical protein
MEALRIARDIEYDFLYIHHHQQHTAPAVSELWHQKVEIKR